MGCQKATDAASYAGSSTYYFPVHQSGVVAEAYVATDKNGSVTDAYLNEWMGPSTWAAGNAALVGGEIIRIKMAGMNTATVVAGQPGYVFFYYNFISKGWVELSLPTATTSAWAAPTPAKAATTPTFDLRMANQLYSKAYADACNAVVASASSTDLILVSIPDAAIGVVPVCTQVGTSNAATLVANTATKALMKNLTASQYFPMNDQSDPSTTPATVSRTIGYRENYKAMLKFFKANPTADYAAAKAVAGVALGPFTNDNYSTALVQNAAKTATDIPGASNYAAGTDTVWEVADVVSGATYSDFPAYTMGLQTAYLMAIGDPKDGNVRRIK